MKKNTPNPIGIKLDTFSKKYYGKVILLKNFSVVHAEIITYSRLKSKLIGLIWKYMPDSNFKNRNYFIADID